MGFGNLGTWELGNLGTWELANLGTWELGNLGTWELANLGTNFEATQDRLGRLGANKKSPDDKTILITGAQEYHLGYRGS